jgi:serine/threonine-protein kinase
VAGTKLIESEHGGVERIGRYELIAEIASGGMATVYLARLSGVGGFQRNVALKRLHPHLAQDHEFIQMFLDEARLAASIHHPNVVPILDVDEDPGGHFLVMDYVEGDTFATLLSRAALDGKQVPREISMRIIVDMLSGLHAAHELTDEEGHLLGLVHRDVSPQNILCGTDGVTRITDFGVARAASRLSATRAGQLKGKLAYMAPEQVGGDEDIDRRADVFSAGVVLWEALALKRLFKASNEAATLQRVLNDQIVSPRELSTDVPEAVAEVCLRALRRPLDERFVSCGEFGDALERAASANGCLATQREVASYVQEIVGPAVESHRRAIRTWLQRRGRVSESSMPSIRAPGHVPPPPRRDSNSSSVLSAANLTAPSYGVGSLPPPPSLPMPSLPPAPPSVLSSRLAYHPPRPGVSAAPPPVGPMSTTPMSYAGPGAAPATLVSALPPDFERPAPKRGRLVGMAIAGGVVLLAGMLFVGRQLSSSSSDQGAAAAAGASVQALGAASAISEPKTSPPVTTAAAAASTAGGSAASGPGASGSAAGAQVPTQPSMLEPSSESDSDSDGRSGRSKRSRVRTPGRVSATPKPVKGKSKLPDLENPYQ